MALPVLESPSLWRSRDNLPVAVDYFIDKISRDASLKNLAQSPIETLENHPAVTVQFVSSAPGSCSVSGYYRPHPPTISVHRANSEERDNFTVLHEYGHHLQQSDPEWAFAVLAELDVSAREYLEEDVADAIARKILLPDAVLEEHFGDAPLSAPAIAKLYASTAASRQACCRAAYEWTTDRALILLTDLQGEVRYCMSTHDSLYTVPRQQIQPDIARLIRQATEGSLTAAGVAESGLVYSTANRRHDIKFDIAIDHHVRWAFVVARSLTRYGNQHWAQETRDCSNPACDTQFSVNAVTPKCRVCEEYKCPECHGCSCESQLPVCTECWTQLSSADFAAGLSRHAFHDE